MQSLKNIVINAAIMLVFLFGLTVSAIADDTIDQLKVQAEQGDAIAQARLGVIYSQGKGVRQDYSKAFYWYQKSADQGLSGAQVTLGISYHKGEGVRQDYSKALYWLRKAADQKNTIAQNYIGLLYKSGEGVRQNKTTAKEWHGMACDNGDQYGCDWYKELNEQGY